jgi:hypothetical protein
MAKSRQQIIDEGMTRIYQEQEIESLRAQLASAQAEKKELVQAAQAVVDRWHTPLWKDAPATATYIQNLEAILRKENF